MKINKLISEEIEKFKLCVNYSPEKTLTENLNEQLTPSGISQEAINKIVEYSKANKSKLGGRYLFPTQQNEIDKLFGVGTYSKFFYGGGREILDGVNDKKPNVVTQQQKPAIPIPSGVSQDAINKIIEFSNYNKSKSSGRYLFPTQQNEIDKLFGVGTYEKFFNGGGRDVLDGKKVFNSSSSKVNPPNSSASKVKPPKSSKTPWKQEPITLDDTVNTLKKSMQGSKIKLLQQKLGIKGKGGQSLSTGQFWNYTDAKLKQTYPNEYTTEKGVTKSLFNKITGSS